MEIFTFIVVVLIFFNVLSIKKQIVVLQQKQQHVTKNIDERVVSPVAEAVPMRVGEPDVITPAPIVPQVPVYPTPLYAEMPRAVEMAPAQAPVQTPAGESLAEIFITWFKRDWLAKFGGLILLIGIGWFVSYAFAEGWVGEQGRIMIGLAVGALMLAFGYIRIRPSSLQGGLFLILGLTTILMTVWTAQEMYAMFAPVIALSLMFFTVVFVSIVAVLYKKNALATVALILGFCAPLLTNTTDPSFAGLNAYLLIVVVGTIFVVAFTGWRHLLLISVLTVWLYGLPFSYDVSSDIAGIALLFAFIFSAIFIVMANRTLVYNVKNPSPVDLYTIGCTGLYLLMWINAAAPAHWEATLYSAWAVTFAVIGYVMFRLTDDMYNFLVNGAVALTYITLAITALFDGPMLTIALSVEAACLPALVYMVTGKKTLLINTSLLLLVPVFLSLESVISTAWRDGVPFGHLMVLWVLGCAGVVLGLFIREKGKEIDDANVAQWGGALTIMGILYFLVLIWLVPQGFFAPNYDLGRLVSLVLYTIIGVTTYMMGHARNSAEMRFGGGLLVGMVILRLLFVEVWDMQMSMRIVTFVMVGVMLIATAFIEKKDKA
jgi:uncharacterized membrane protein